MTDLAFKKMHGLGNDFVVLDGRSDARALSLTEDEVRHMADRKVGIGCDQFIVIEPAKSAEADAFMRIRNADGGEVEACGNAARCIADVLMDESGKDHVVVETVVGLLEAERGDTGLISVDMGPANLDWREIPIKDAVDTNHIPLELGPLKNPVGVNVGNPHAVFFVEDTEAVDIEKWGPLLEHHPMFPERANIEVAHINKDGSIRMRVWERGVGVTQACGTGACAVLVAAARRKLTGREAVVHLDGGPLTIQWLPDNHILMTGPAELAFSGRLSLADH